MSEPPSACRRCGVALTGSIGICVRCYQRLHAPCLECMRPNKRRGQPDGYSPRPNRRGEPVDCRVCNNERWVLREPDV